MASRYSQIDIAKGIGIILIVQGHYWVLFYGLGEVFNVIYSFHVPLFFFLSGIFMDYSDSLSQTAIKKSDSYLKPYFVALLFMSIFIIPNENINPMKYIGGILYGVGKTIPIKFLPLWFLPHLWTVSIFSFLLYRCTNLRSKSIAFNATVLGVMLCVGYLGIHTFWNNRFPGIPILFPGLPFSIDLIFISSFYFLLGSLLKDYITGLKFNPMIFLLSVFVFCSLHFFYNITMDLNLRRYDNLFISTIEALTGIYIIITASILLDKNAVIRRILVYIGSGSLFILLFHFWIQMGSARLIYSLIDDKYYVIRFIIIKYLSFTLAVLLPLAFFELVKRSSTLGKLFLPIKSAKIVQPGGSIPQKSGHENVVEK